MRHDWALLLGFGLAIVGCCGALAYIAAGGPATAMPMIAGLACGVVGQVLLLVMIVRQNDAFHARFGWLSRSLAELRSEMRFKTDQAFSRIHDVQVEARSRTDSVIGGISDLKTSYSALKQSLAAQVANPPPKSEPEGVVEGVKPDAAGMLSGTLNVALEPVVDMRSRRTAHYRLHMSMTAGETDVDEPALLEQVTRAGLRSRLDRLAIEEALNLLARLRQRDPDLCIITPVGPPTLADEAAIKRMMKASLEAGDSAKGLVLELNHALLPQLTPRSLEGLAQLSRHGQAFALADAAPGALDLAAMKTLHVRVVELDASQLQNANGLQAATSFAWQARQSGISCMITGMKDPQMIDRLVQVTPLACGPCFATPRRVKRMEDNARKLVQAA